jgi:hypothetical protein
MSDPNLGRLERVELRAAWSSESGDFTPWLASDDNIALLGDAIGIDLEVEAQEKQVGPFRADILCKDTSNDTWVLIENQLERTDHTHLGQLITYAAGLKAVTIVWIAARITEEHRAALDWLNEITDGSFRFFGLEVELWRIGNSPSAPKFNVVCEPNDWSQNVTAGARRVVEGELTPARQIQLEFWTAFREYAIEHSRVIKPTKPLPQQWMSMSIGRSGFQLTAVASTWDSEAESYGRHELRAELVLLNDRSKHQFRQLADQKIQIESDLGYPIEWAESPERKQSKVCVRRTADLHDRNAWPNYCDWLLKNLEDFHRVFANRVKQLVVNAPRE